MFEIACFPNIAQVQIERLYILIELSVCRAYVHALIQMSCFTMIVQEDDQSRRKVYVCLLREKALLCSSDLMCVRL